MAADAGAPATITVGETVIASHGSRGLPADEARRRDAEFKRRVADTLKTAGYPAIADPSKMNKPLIVGILVILVTMVCGPIAAMLVEMFPTRIRYTSMSLPYQIGNS